MKRLTNYTMVESSAPATPGREPKSVAVGLSAETIRRALTDEIGNWPKTVGGSLFVVDEYRIVFLDSTNDVFAWLQTFCANGDANGVHWISRGAGFISQAEWVAYLRQQCERFEAVESAPHEPPFEGHFYLYPPLQGGDGRALRALADRFSPATEEDHFLIIAYFMTLVWGGPCGKRPAFLFTGLDEDTELGRGIGKSTVATMGARLVGGTFDVRPTDKWEDVVRRLLSDSTTQRVILIDNVKAMRFSWSDVEALITSPSINGFKMYVGDGRRPNTFTVAITLNGANLSKDMAQRSVIIKLDRPTYSSNWEDETTAFIDANRLAILGDIVAMLKTPPSALPSVCRWGNWDRDIIGRLPEPERLQDVIMLRRAEVDDDQEEAVLIREAIMHELVERAHGDPDSAGVKFPANVMAEIVSKATGERLSVKASGTKLKTLMGAISELRRGKIGGKRVWKWQGKNHSGNLEDLSANRIGSWSR